MDVLGLIVFGGVLMVAAAFISSYFEKRAKTRKHPWTP